MTSAATATRPVAWRITSTKKESWKMALKTIRVCDTAGCDSTENVTTIKEGDFCEPCLDGQRYANETYPKPYYADVEGDQ